jgi:hypothetical protein
MKKSSRLQTGEPAGTPHKHKPNPPQLLLVFSSRRLLTEKSSVPVHPFLLEGEKEILTIRATVMTVIMKNIQGYDYPGFDA